MFSCLRVCPSFLPSALEYLLLMNFIQVCIHIYIGEGWVVISGIVNGQSQLTFDRVTSLAVKKKKKKKRKTTQCQKN